jgi:murein DD-endopeptidase MepM/ murein hydrolase activator NlpD
MKKKIYIGLIILILFAAFFFLAKNTFLKKNPPPAPTASVNTTNPQNSSTTPANIPDKTLPNTQNSSDNQNTSNSQNVSGFQPPLDRAAERVTKKPFGIFITPQTSPVQPERFRGYHTGTDFEIFPEELNADVTVHAICSGTIALKKTASGYGGVLVQNCTLENQPVTVIYGHLKLASISKNTGDNLNAGETIGILGKVYSSETDGERKHLHLGVHKGRAVNILGYVSSQAGLSGWIDPCLYVCQ